MTTLHHQLADAQGALRDAEDFYRLCKAMAEERANIEGRNEAERTRKLIIAIAADADYGRALFRLRGAEQAVDRLKADLAAQEDDRRAYEWSIRAGLVEALGSHEPFDAAMDAAYVHRLEEELRAIAESKGCDAANWDGGSRESCEHCQILALLNKTGHDPDDIGLSHGDPNSTHYAGQRRPQPTYSMLAELPDDWYKHD